MNDQPNCTENKANGAMLPPTAMEHPSVNDHTYGVASSTGFAVASVVGTFSYLRPILFERPLLAFLGFDLAPYTGLTSILVLVALNLINRNTWKTKYDQESETTARLRATIDDLMKENRYLKEALRERPDR